jgi:hypothetical protein
LATKEEQRFWRGRRGRKSAGLMAKDILITDLIMYNDNVQLAGWEVEEKKDDARRRSRSNFLQRLVGLDWGV